MPSRLRQIVFPLLAAFIWGTAFVSQSMSTEYLGAFAYNAARGVVACLFLGLVITFFKKIRPSDFPKKTKKDKKLLLISGVSCGVLLTLATNLQQLGIFGTSVGKAGFITALYVVLVPVFGLFVGKKAPGFVWISVALSVVGLYLLCVKEDFTIVPADLLILGCAVVFAVHILVIDRFTDRVNGIEMSCVQFAVVAVISLVFSLIFEETSMQNLIDCAGPILYAGVLSSGVAYTLQILALDGKSNPTVVSILMSLESFFAAVSGAVILGEKLSMGEYIGCGAMLAAVLLAQIPGKRKRA